MNCNKCTWYQLGVCDAPILTQLKCCAMELRDKHDKEDRYWDVEFVYDRVLENSWCDRFIGGGVIKAGERNEQNI